MRTFSVTREAFITAAALLLTFVIVLPAQAQTSNQSQTREQRRAELRAELQRVQEQIDQQEGKLSNKRDERQSLERDVEILEGEINQAQLEIQEKDIQINSLTGTIAEKRDSIDTLTAEIDRKQDSLAELVRRHASLQDISLVEVALSNESLSEIFEDIDTVRAINSSMQARFEEIRGSKQALESERASLASQRNQVTNARQAVASQKEEVERKEAQKEELAAVARNEERSYEEVLAAQKEQAQRIRNQLFSLRDVSAIPFGRALQFAREVSTATGIRPAFLLAVIQQESNLGQNVGTCNRPQDPPSKNWDQIMKPSRDIPPYRRITSQLGIAPDTMPLSCPYGAGWGGAMGHAQFNPSTWAKYQNRIGNALGVSVPNPWEPRHAFMASGIYLTDLGAGAQTYTAEKRAALQYYSGSNWQSPSVQFYGDQVLQRAQTIQTTMIDPIDQAAGN